MSQSRYRIAYTKPSQTGINGRSTGSVFFSDDATYMEQGAPGFASQGYTVTVTDLITQETKTFNPTK